MAKKKKLKQQGKIKFNDEIINKNKETSIIDETPFYAAEVSMVDTEDTLDRIGNSGEKLKENHKDKIKPAEAKEPEEESGGLGDLVCGLIELYGLCTGGRSGNQVIADALKPKAQKAV